MGIRLLRLYLAAFVWASVFLGCGSSASVGTSNLSSNGSPLSSEGNVIIQTRMDGTHLDIFTLGQPILPGVTPYVYTNEERERDYLADRAILGRNTDGTIYRHPIIWNMSTDQGTTQSRVSLDGGDGAYVTDFAIETVRRVSLPTVDGTYNYEYVVSNTKGYSINTGYTYTRSGGTATVTWRDFSGAVYQLHSGSPLTSFNVGFGMTILNPFGYANETTQDARYTGTWTIAEIFPDGVTGETGKFDLRRIGITNLQVEPSEFNPAANEEATISGDIVGLPVSTELTPDGWSPSGPVNWLIEVKDPLGSADNVHVLASSSAVTPGESGKIASFNSTWNGKDTSGETLLNATYPIRIQAAANLSSGNVLSKEVASQVRLGNRSVAIENLDAEPKNFEPENGEITTISFLVKATGFDAPTLSWEVAVFQEDVQVYTFPDGQASGVDSKEVSLEWDGIGSTGIISGEVEYRITAKACDDGVQARFAEPIRQRALFQTTGGSCALAEEDMVASLGGGIRITLRQDGRIVNQVRPSYLFEGYGEQLGPAPQPGDGPTDGPHAFGEASIVTIEVEVLENFDRDEVEITLHALGASDSGHVHGEPPAGSFNKEPQVYPQSLREHLSIRAKPSVYLGVLQKGESIEKEWVAPFASGEYTFEARETSTGDSLEEKVLGVQVDGLKPIQLLFTETEMGADGNVAFIGETGPHPENHYGSVKLNNRLATVVRLYRQKMDILDNNGVLPSVPFSLKKPSTYEKKVFVNDMSLPRGGLFAVAHSVGDFLPVTGATEGHWEHRTGENADLITEYIDRGVNVLFENPMRDPHLETILHAYGFDIYNEIDRLPDTPHYHIRLRKDN